METREDELCLLLARAQLPPEAEQRARELLAGPLAWNQILERVRAHEILPLVCYNLERMGFTGVSEPVRAELMGIFRNNALRNVLLARELARVLSLLGEAAVPVMPLKGTALAESLYGDPALRVCADIDILVSPKHFAEAFQLLLSCGYEAGFTQAPLVELLARYGKDCALMRQDRAFSYPLQLHCGLIWGGRTERHLAEEIWSEASRTTFHGVPAFALSAEWEFLYLAVHAARHGLRPLKWLVDLDRLCHRSTLDWKAVKDKAKRLGWEQAVQSSLSACASFLDTPVPAPFLETAQETGEVVPGGQEHEAGRRNQESKIKNQRSPAELNLKSRIQNLKSPDHSPGQVPRETLFSVRLLTSSSEKLRFLATRLFVPTPADCQFVALPSWLFFLYYALRPLRVVCLVAWWLVQAGLSALRGFTA